MQHMTSDALTPDFSIDHDGKPILGFLVILAFYAVIALVVAAVAAI